ncbi:hypothetical protein AQUCO_00300189v1 [Aquilegia coerulea]|uniref:fructose-bisphosphatase n=1 Tax=Aquilegia coerulea TaxID=218851 RepID=A0A2G5EXY5_AQUCA|nr:hypothetical protein AQUCO_00300189v1 [Aquilegia coerulea]
MFGAELAIPSRQLLYYSTTTITTRWSNPILSPHPSSVFTGISSPLQIGLCRAAAAGKVIEEDVSKQKKTNAFEIESLTSWLLEQQRVGNLDAELTIVINSISLACKQIASLLQTANISKLTGSQGTINIQGENQAKLDVIANEVFCNCLRSTGLTGIIASEEEEAPIAVEETYSGNYTVVFDPIDGSSNIDTSLTTGSIFGIYDSSNNKLGVAESEQEPEESNSTPATLRKLDEKKQKTIVSVCQPGRNLLAAGYCMYSSSVVFVLSLGKGVFSFTLDPMYGEFILTQKNIQIPKSAATPSGAKRYSARYIGCLVGEIHRTLLYGGIYGNPSNIKSKKGNLRLLYECAPMSYLVEQAGGKGSNGYQRILDIVPEEVHQRVPIFIGSPEEVAKLEKYLA